MTYFFGFLLIALFIWFLISRLRDLSRLKKGVPKLRSDLNMLKADLHRLQSLYDPDQMQSPEAAAHVPHDSYLDKAGLPHEFGTVSELDDRYYLGFNPETGVVHEPWCQHCGPLVNIIEIRRLCLGAMPRPCMKCHSRLPDISWVNRYKSILSDLEPVEPGITARHLDLLRRGDAPGCVLHIDTGPKRPSEDDLAVHLQACVDAAYQELFAGKPNPYTGQPILSEKDYLSYSSEYQRRHGKLPDLPQTQADGLRRIAFRRNMCQRFLRERLQLFRSGARNILHMK